MNDETKNLSDFFDVDFIVSNISLINRLINTGSSLASGINFENVIRETVEQLRDKFLLSRISEEGGYALLKSQKLKDQFLKNESCNAFVLSVDIRRSTELMLKSRSPKQFVSFIRDLCEKLNNTVKSNYGVIDKFTGDGILAFFPDFYSGEDAGYYAVKAATLCHEIFSETYKKNRSAFVSILKDIGLGIGIDYGVVHLVRMAEDDLTVVGSPVVYACRMSGGQAGMTLLNVPAYEIISERFSEHVCTIETHICIKHEGSTVAHEVTSSSKCYNPKKPDWFVSQQDTK